MQRPISRVCRLLAPAAFFCGVLTQLPAFTAEPMLRRPVAIACSLNGDTLFVANRDSGTISLIDVPSQSVTSEISVGGHLSALTVVGSDRLLALDSGQHRLVCINRLDSQWSLGESADVSGFPTRFVVDLNENRCYVASSWSRSVTTYGLPSAGPAEKLSTIELPFEPQEMCLLEGGKQLIVAGAFAAKIAVVDCETQRLVSARSLPGHNIRGLALGPDDTLLLTMQELNPLAHSTRDDVHWGNMLSNLLVSLPLSAVLDSRADLGEHRVATLLGEPGRAAGDPGQIIFSQHGKMVVLLSGVAEVATGSPEIAGKLARIPVQSRPVAAVASNDTLYVANMFSDSVSIVNLESGENQGAIKLGPTLPLSAAEKGEVLFFNSQLSLDGWMSCHSCHTEGHTNGQRNDNLSDGGFGDSKLVPSLLGVAETAPWGWTGSVSTLPEQVVNSVENTMRGKSLSSDDVDALVEFMRTLELPRSRDPGASKESDSIEGSSLRRGDALFNSLGCANCHEPPSFTSERTFDVGLQDTVGNERFNPPSLLGVKNRTRFLHDGRAPSLDSVFGEFKHQLPTPLQEGDLADLIAYLNSL